MPLINTAVPNLIQGVSQQSDATRFLGQCEDQENALSSVAKGLMKRPYTQHVAKLMSEAIRSDSFVHFINRSESEKYVVITYKNFDSNNNHTGCKIRAFNLIDGTEATIRVGGVSYNASFLSMTNPATDANYTQSEINDDEYLSNTSYTFTSVNTPYLHANTPSKDLKALSIGDTTLLLNTTYRVAPKTTKTSAFKKEGLVFVTQGGFSKRYFVHINVLHPESAPAAGTAPSIAFEMERTTHRTTYPYSITYYKWHIKSVELISGGADIEEVPTITWGSNAFIYTQPNVQLTLDTDEDSATYQQIIDVNIVNNARGDFQGVGSIYGSVEPSVYYTISGYGSGVLQSNPNMLVANTVDGTGNTNGDKWAANSEFIASQIRTSLATNLGTAYWNSIENPNNSNCVFFSLKDDHQDKDFTLSTSDSLADTGLQGIYKVTDTITSLPFKNKNGFKVKIKGDPELSEDDFYVEFQTAQGQDFGDGSYIETVGNEIVEGFEASTMPHQLVNEGLNLFTLKEANYKNRVAGDDNSNPLPSFVGSEIDGMFFFKNRLGFLSKENIIMSEAGFGGINDFGQMIFNFGRTTVTALLDSDPIDVSVATSRVTNLKAAKGFQENLIVFAENGQFVLKGGDVLTPRTVSIIPVTNFNFEDQVEPLPLGSYIYFPFTRGNFSGVREFTVNANTEVYDSVEITEHVPSYVPKNIIDMTGTTSEDVIALLSSDEKNSLYIYNYFWNNNQKVQSAWSKFTFDAEIRGIEFIESSLHAVITNNNETHLVKLNMEAGLVDDAGYNTYLDMRVSATVANGADQITLPYTPENNSVEVYTKDGLKLNATNLGSTVNLAQAVTTDTPVFVGIPFTMKYTFSNQIFKAPSGQGKSPSPTAKLLLRNGSIHFDKTAFFKVKVTPKFRDTFENVFTPTIVNSTPIGGVNLDTGSYRFPVFTRPEDTTITIENSSALPSTFQSAEFESFIHSRSTRLP